MTHPPAGPSTPPPPPAPPRVPESHSAARTRMEGRTPGPVAAVASPEAAQRSRTRHPHAERQAQT